MIDQMTPGERIRAALAGEDVDSVPFGLWRHFPGEDGTPDDLVNATLRFQHLFGSDMVKLMPTGMYSVVPYGVEIEPTGDAGGTTRYVSGPIREPEDWTRLSEAPLESGVLRDHIEVVGRVRKALGGDIAILQTIFSPLTMANKMVGATGTLGAHSRSNPESLRVALEVFTGDVIGFGRACINAGASGFFFATQLGNRRTLGEDFYREFGVPFDLQVLNALRGDTWFSMLHLHGEEPLFDLADLYPVDAVNWHDRETTPPLRDALDQTRRCLIGGIERGGAVRTGTPEQVELEVEHAVEQTGGRRLIVGPGCVIPCDSPAENLHAVRKALIR